VLSDSAVCAPGYDLDVSSGWCQYIPDPLFGAECVSGLIFDPERLCCEVVGGTPDEYFVCPPGSTYDSCSQACVYSEVLGPGDMECVDGSVYFDTCRPPDKPHDSCDNPGAYTTQASCVAAGCTWNPSAAGGPGGTCSN
jgi:hypothetical protein